MIKTKKLKGRGRKLSETMKNSKRKLANVKMVERKIVTKEKKLAREADKVLKLKNKIADQLLKYERAEQELAREQQDLEWYKRELTYTDLQRLNLE